MDSASQPQRMIAYLRVSTDEQAVSGLGLEAQAEMVRRAFDYRGWQLVDVVRDEGVSGSTLNRPGLRHALERIVAGDADGLVVAKLDRLTRSMRDFCEIGDWFEEAGAALVMLEPDVDTSTPAGRAVAHVLVAFAQMERGMIGDRTKVALAAKRARGEATGRPAIADNPQLVARVHELYARHPSLSEVARILTDEGWPTVRGGRAWRASALQRIVGYQRPPARRRRAELPDIPRRRHRRQP
jgi:DNA invertase Pin-like site-specific DNA recombinase